VSAGPGDPLAPVEAPADLRRLGRELKRLGPAYQRLGHYLATRADVLGLDQRNALIELGDHSPQTPWPAAQEVLTAALGGDFFEFFANVEEAALWSHGLAQAHRGTLPDGSTVTVKIVRPGAGAAASEAIRWLPEGLPALLASITVAPAGGVADLVADASEWLERQTDLTTEADNIVQLRRLSATSEFEYIPLPYLDLCSQTLLVTEYVGGVRAGDVPAAGASVLRELGVDPVRAARVLLTVIARQAFRYRCFQADMHPDNVLALPGAVVSFVDWSGFGRLDRPLAEEQLDYLTAVFEEDTERALDPPTEIAALDSGHLAAFRRQLLDVVRARAGVDSSPTAVPAPLELLAEVLRAGREHRIDMPEGGHLLYRSLVSAERAARALDPDVESVDVMRRALGVARVGSKMRKLQPDRVEATLFDLARLVRDLPGHLQKIFSDLADGSLSLNVWVAEVAQAERNRNRRTRLLVAAVVSVSLAILLGAPHLPRLGGLSIAWPLGVALGVLYGWLLFEWRRLR
jgi:ubiquinone biosynthesis protein